VVEACDDDVLAVQMNASGCRVEALFEGSGSQAAFAKRSIQFPVVVYAHERITHRLANTGLPTHRRHLSCLTETIEAFIATTSGSG
jgi:hypothetical protein